MLLFWEITRKTSNTFQNKEILLVVLEIFDSMSILLKLGSPLIKDKLTSCQTLKKSGNTKSMIYNLKGENDKFPRLAYCDMANSEGYDDPSMEKKLGYCQRLNKKSLRFIFQKFGKFWSVSKRPFHQSETSYFLSIYTYT